MTDNAASLEARWKRRLSVGTQAPVHQAGLGHVQRQQCPYRLGRVTERFRVTAAAYSTVAPLAKATDAPDAAKREDRP